MIRKIVAFVRSPLFRETIVPVVASLAVTWGANRLTAMADQARDDLDGMRAEYETLERAYSGLQADYRQLQADLVNVSTVDESTGSELEQSIETVVSA